MSLAFGVGNMTMKKIMVDKCELESQTVKKKNGQLPFTLFHKSEAANVPIWC